MQKVISNQTVRVGRNNQRALRRMPIATTLTSCQIIVAPGIPAEPIFHRESSSAAR